MLIKTIEYGDFDGNMRKEEFLFNLTEAEVAEWLTTNHEYTIDKVFESLAKKRNVREIIEVVKDLILRSYGEKSLDGRRFIKKDSNGNRLADEFAETNAFSDLLMELVTDAEKTSAFIKGVLPDTMREDITKVEAERKAQEESNTALTAVN